MLGCGLPNSLYTIGAGEAGDVAFGEQGELDGADVAETEKQRAAFAHPCAERGEVDVRQDARRTVAAAQPHQYFRRFDAAGGDVLEVGDALRVGAGETLVAARTGFLVGYGKACVIQARQAEVDAVDVFGETGRGDHAQYVVAVVDGG